MTCQIIKATVNLMPILKNDQKGIVPLIIVLVLSLAIVGGGAVVYSQKEVIVNKLPKKLREQTGAVFFKPKKQPGEINFPQPKAELAKRSVNYETKGTEVEGLPNINMYPPLGWIQKGSEGDDVLVFEASDKDYIWVGKSNLWTIAKITVRVTKSEGESLQEAVNQYKDSFKAQIPTVYIYENKNLIGGVEAYYLEADHDLRKIRRAAVEEELSKTGKNFSQSDLTKLVEIDMIRSATYILRKNGYDVVISGRASAIAWDKRGSEIKKSMMSLVFMGK